jgi:hypothetical protein
VQVLSDKAPVDAENVPGGHFMQLKAAPILGEYVPKGHGCLSLAPPGQKNPTGHNEQATNADVAPACPYFPVYCTPYVLAGHNEQVAADADVAPACPYFPKEHGVPEQVDEEVAPTPSECVPAGQYRQYSAPVSSTYLPAGHNEQVLADDADVAPVCPYFPAEQGVPEQVEKEVAPTSSEYVPAGQSQQASAPVEGMYVPAGHNEQVAADPDVAPVCPYFPTEHSVPEQFIRDMAPTPSEYVPEEQDWQY